MEPRSEQAETEEQDAGAKPGLPPPDERGTRPPQRLSHVSIEMNVSRIATQIAQGRDPTYD